MSLFFPASSSFFAACDKSLAPITRAELFRACTLIVKSSQSFSSYAFLISSDLSIAVSWKMLRTEIYASLEPQYVIPSSSLISLIPYIESASLSIFSSLKSASPSTSSSSKSASLTIFSLGSHSINLCSRTSGLMGLDK